MDNESKDKKELLNNKDSDFKNAKEKIYDKIPLNLKQLDIIIIILVVLFFGALIIGYLKGNGLI